MNKLKDRVDYQERLNRVIAFIHDHLDEEIDLNRLADVACLSPYHWHRIYHAMNGETITATVRRLRLHRAAGFLANTAMADRGDRGEVRLRQCRGVHAGVHRRLRHAAGAVSQGGRAREISGADARRRRRRLRGDDQDRARRDCALAAIDHKGSYMEIGRAFEPLYGWFAARGLLAPATRSIGIYYDDPFSVAEAELRSRAGLVVATRLPVRAAAGETDVRGGRHAVLRHKGPYATMRSAYQWFYGAWLTQSGEEVADAPVFEEYLNNPRDTAPADLLTDIYLPLKRDEHHHAENLDRKIQRAAAAPGETGADRHRRHEEGRDHAGADAEDRRRLHRAKFRAGRAWT